MEINFTSDVLKKWGAIALIVLVLAGGVYYLGISGVFDRLFSNDLPESEVEAGGIAAAQGVEVVFNLDYEEPVSVWLERLCAISTKSGCQVMATFWVGPIETVLETQNPRTTCSADFIEKVESGEETEGVGEDEVFVYEWEIWQVNASLDNPWEGVEAETSYFVYVSNEEGEWKFGRILFEQEAEKYQEEGVQ